MGQALDTNNCLQIFLKTCFSRQGKREKESKADLLTEENNFYLSIDFQVVLMESNDSFLKRDPVRAPLT